MGSLVSLDPRATGLGLGRAVSLSGWCEPELDWAVGWGDCTLPCLLLMMERSGVVSSSPGTLNVSLLGTISALSGQDPNWLPFRGMLGLAVVPVCDTHPPLHAQGPQMPMALYTCPTRRWSPLLEAWCSVREKPSGSWRSWPTRRASCRTHGTRWAPPPCLVPLRLRVAGQGPPHTPPGPRAPASLGLAQLHRRSLKPLHLPPRRPFLGWLGKSARPLL